MNVCTVYRKKAGIISMTTEELKQCISCKQFKKIYHNRKSCSQCNSEKSLPRKNLLKNRSDQEMCDTQSKLFPNHSRVCMTCDTEKDLDEFSRDRTIKCGVKSSCKICITALRKSQAKIERDKETLDGKSRSHKCFTCKLEKKSSEFYKANERKSGVMSNCKTCMIVISENKRKIMNNYRNALKSEGCASCKFQTTTALQFAHIDRTKKHRTKSGKTLNPTRINCVKVFEKELKFLEVLCANCHRLRTTQENKDMRVETESAIYHRKKRLQSQSIVNNEKLKRKCCVDCKFEVLEQNVSVFEFDHVDPSTKINDISKMSNIIGYFTFQQIQDEMAKCELRCANCHQIKTYNDRKNKKVSVDITVNQDSGSPDINISYLRRRIFINLTQGGLVP